METAHSPRFEGDIYEFEQHWLVVYPYLTADGYVLRDRFNPGYLADVSSAVDNESPPARGTPNRPVPWKNRVSLQHPRLMDATRAMDGLPVMLKAIDLSRGIRHHEWKIARIFAERDVSGDPRNHCIRLLDYLRYPGLDWEFLVMPHMLPFHVTPFETVGEVVDFLRQLLEGVAFMHSLNVTHRDIGPYNIVMYAPDLFPDGTNYLYPGNEGDGRVPTIRKARYRARRDVNIRYYLIDFGLSWAFKDSASRRPLEVVLGQLKDAPEYALGNYCDGFALDVWCIGRLMQRYFYETYRLPKFLTDFVQTLMQSSPSDRPTAVAALAAFDDVIAHVDQDRLNRSLTASWPRMSLLKSLQRALSKEQARPQIALTASRNVLPPFFPTKSELSGVNSQIQQ